MAEQLPCVSFDHPHIRQSQVRAAERCQPDGLLSFRQLKGQLWHPGGHEVGGVAFQGLGSRQLAGWGLPAAPHHRGQGDQFGGDLIDRPRDGHPHQRVQRRSLQNENPPSAENSSRFDPRSKGQRSRRRSQARPPAIPNRSRKKISATTCPGVKAVSRPVEMAPPSPVTESSRITAARETISKPA